MNKAKSSNKAKEQGRRIEEIRDMTHLSRRAFSSKHQISYGTLQNWESGRYKGLTQEGLITLIQAFRKEGIEVTTDYLLYGSGAKPYFYRESGSSSSLKFQMPEKFEMHEFQYDKNKLIELTLLNAEKHKINSQLYEATNAGRYSEVVHLIKDSGATLHLQSGISTHLYDNNENTPLHIAATNGYLNIVEFLIQEGGTVDVRNRRKQTPLHLASHNGHCDIVEFLIKKGANVDAVEDEGGTPLSWAAYVGQLEVARQLLACGANIQSCDSQSNTILHWACYHGRIDVMKFLIENGADVTRKNSNNKLPLDFAVENGQIEAVKLLLLY